MSTPKYIMQILEGQDEIKVLLQGIPTREEFQTLANAVEEHDHFINGNGEKGAKAFFAAFEATLSQILVRLNNVETRPIAKPPAKPDKTTDYWKWAAGVMGTAIVALLIYLVEMHVTK